MHQLSRGCVDIIIVGRQLRLLEGVNRPDGQGKNGSYFTPWTLTVYKNSLRTKERPGNALDSGGHRIGLRKMANRPSIPELRDHILKVTQRTLVLSRRSPPLAENSDNIAEARQIILLCGVGWILRSCSKPRKALGSLKDDRSCGMPDIPYD